MIVVRFYFTNLKKGEWIMKGIKQIVIFGVGIALVLSIIYGCYWVAKTVSYSFFYEDMVKRTVTQMVKPEALK